MMYPTSSLWILAGFGSKTLDVILFSSPTFNKICCAVVCPIPNTYCKDVSVRFLFDMSTPPIHAHWMTRFLNPEPHCLTKPITLRTNLKESAPKSMHNKFWNSLEMVSLVSLVVPNSWPSNTIVQRLIVGYNIFCPTPALWMTRLFNCKPRYLKSPLHWWWSSKCSH